MSTRRSFLSVAIPYVNAEPHLGYAFELVEADLVARARRRAGEAVYFVGGTDEHSLKNVLAAEAAGEAVRPFVDRHAERFAELAARLHITFDDFVRTSSDPRHGPAVERLWRACAAAGDLYQRDYSGWYCVGCEQFYEPDDLAGGRCPEHDRPVEQISERNWFFRLSRYAETLGDLIESGELQIDPEPYRNETLAFLRGEVRDLSVSRSRPRARGWGIAVPDDPSQVVYVWFDALVNYLSALDYGTDGDRYRAWWRNGDERVHVVGKGIARFHAVYWPAFLLSAGVPPPTRVHVHPYLTVDGVKISKSGAGATAADAFETLGARGPEAFRWWSASDVLTTADTSFSVDRLIERADDDLANGLGNTVRRIVALRRRAFGAAPVADVAAPSTVCGLVARVTAALAAFDRRAACAAIVAAVDALNQDIEVRQPWRAPDRQLLDGYVAALRQVADAASPIVPDLAARAIAELDGTTASDDPLWPRQVVGRGGVT